MKRLVPLSLLLVLVLTLVVALAPRETDAAPEWQSFSPPGWILGPIQGADGKEKVVLDNLDTMLQWKIPITAFHFDAPDWMSCAGNAKLRYSNKVLNEMRRHNVRGLFWIVPMIGLNCPEYQIALANDYFVRDDQNQVIVTDDFTGHGSWIDFDKPAAVAWWHTLLDALLARTGNVIGGFYTDSVRPDKVGPDKTGEAVEYGEAYSLDLLNYTRAHIPDGDVVFKRYGKNTPSDPWLNQYAHVAYVNDLPTHFNGMKIGISRVFDSTPLMPLPYNEFSGFNAAPPDAETYIRRMHWGAFQPVMENVPKTAQPWDSQYPQQVMQVYRYYGNLHAELAPYLTTYDRIAYESKIPILRDTDTGKFSARLGDLFWVRYVTNYVTSLKITPPAGEWLNYWNPAQIFRGNKTYTIGVPLGKEPILVARGAIIPMHVTSNWTGHGTRGSAGALTLETFPIQHSTFQYYDPTNGWLTFDVATVKQRAALCSLGGVPSEPLIWRVNGVRNKPNRVSVQNGAVGINTSWGTKLPERASELKVGKSAAGWYYDALARRVIVKISSLGTDCPTP